MAKLTPLAKGLITVVILGGVGTALYLNKERIFPAKKSQGSLEPIKINLPEGPDPNKPNTKPEIKVDLAPPGCTDKPEVRFYHWAWNAQIGMMLATGNKQAAQGSLMCKHGVNLKLTREDMNDQLMSQMLAFAEAHKGGEKHPKVGAHFIAIMGDGSGAFLKALNDQLKKLGNDYTAVIVGSMGYSRGEDKFMGPPEWKKNPQAARGGVVAGVLRDGDWNIALKWLGDNGIPNNPNEKTYDPDALNWIATDSYLDAAAKYVAGYCEERKNVKTRKDEKVCVQGVVTWTPGDVNVAEQKGGLISIVSTKEYRSQMPNVIIGHKKWMKENPALVKGMLAAIFEANDQIKASEDALRKGAGISAVVYNEADAAYWFKYFTVQTEKDKQGLMVELGGSSVNNLADNLELFGLTEGSTNLFAATYTVFGNLVKQQYPEYVSDFYPHEQVTDLTYLKEMAKGTAPAEMARPDLPTFEPTARVEQVVSRKAWSIEFETGKATFTRKTEAVLEQLLNDLVIAGGTLVEIHGHTDNVGGAPKNQALSEERAFAVKKWLEQRSPNNFPQGRIKIFAHGQEQPVEPNSTPEGRAKNRRVEIVMGTATVN
jgi:outer membrane protein OmpA-like peptidoglycan-associated protein